MSSSVPDPEDEVLYCELGQSCTTVRSNACSFRPARTMKVRKLVSVRQHGRSGVIRLTHRVHVRSAALRLTGRIFVRSSHGPKSRSRSTFLTFHVLGTVGLTWQSETELVMAPSQNGTNKPPIVEIDT